MPATRQNRGPVGRAGAHPQRGAVAIRIGGARRHVDAAPVEPAADGVQHAAEHRFAADHQPDVDREIVAAREEAPGSIKGVDQPVTRGAVEARRALALLAHHRGVRVEGLQRGHQNGVGPAIRLGHRGSVGLELGLGRAGRTDRQDRLSGRAHRPLDLADAPVVRQGQRHGSSPREVGVDFDGIASPR